MTRAKGLKIEGRRGFLALGFAVLGLPLAATAGAPTKPASKSTAKPAPQRARLPRRLAADFHSHIDTRLPHLRAPFEAAARDTGLSWRVLAALGYQESRWRPAAVSPRGAQGVMMLMPRTAKKMGVNNVFAADENILGGARYLAYMKERIPKRIRDPDRTWMAMAAYNIGIGHLEDARILAQQQKLNPDLWSDVKKVLPLLALPEYYESAKLGYARGGMPVAFVGRVRGYYDILLRTEAAGPPRLTAGLSVR